VSFERRTFTFIKRTVKLVLGDLALAVIYGLDTVIHAKRIALSFKLIANGFKTPSKPSLVVFPKGLAPRRNQEGFKTSSAIRL
jgi:hypothetical protein